MRSSPGLSAGFAQSRSIGRHSKLSPHTPHSIANSTMNRFLFGTVVLALLASQASAQSVVIVNGQKVVVPAKPGQKPLPPGYVPPSSTGSHTSFLVNGSDNCANAMASDSISGLGTFGVSTVGATSGTPLGSCGAIGNDVWFYWTATCSGTTIVSACGGTTADTVFAIWNDGSPAGTCPTTQITCNDDTCGLQSQVTFTATAGSKYFIEIGTFASGTGFSGTFTISTPPPPTGNDDCSMPIAISGAGPFPVNPASA